MGRRRESRLGWRSRATAVSTVIEDSAAVSSAPAVRYLRCDQPLPAQTAVRLESEPIGRLVVAP